MSLSPTIRNYNGIPDQIRKKFFTIFIKNGYFIIIIYHLKKKKAYFLHFIYDCCMAVLILVYGIKFDMTSEEELV